MTDVLVLRALGLGDLLTSVPALRGLRGAWPHTRLVLAAPPALGKWLVGLGVVDDVVPAHDLREVARLSAWECAADVAVNLHGRGPQSHRVLTTRVPAARLVAYACPEADHDDGPPWRDDEHEVDRWIRLSSWAGGRAAVEDLSLPPPGPAADHVVVHPGAASASRRWPVARWAGLVSRLSAEGHPVVVTGGPAEAQMCAAVVTGSADVADLAGRLDLTGLACVVGTAALVVSGDTGVAHLATAFARPSVTLFGPVSPTLWGPRIDPDRHRALWSGDLAHPRPGNPHGAVLDSRLAAIDVSTVLASVHEMLQRR